MDAPAERGLSSVRELLPWTCWPHVSGCFEGTLVERESDPTKLVPYEVLNPGPGEAGPHARAVVLEPLSVDSRTGSAPRTFPTISRGANAVPSRGGSRVMRRATLTEKTPLLFGVPQW